MRRGGGGGKMEGFAMADVGSLTTWMPGPLLGDRSNFGGGVELDNRFLMLDQFRALGMVMVWIMACVAKLLLSVLPGMMPLPLLTNFLQKLSAAGDGGHGHGVTYQQQQQQHEGKRSVGNRRNVKVLSGTAIGRALTQVLSLVNDVPASSNKYTYLQSLADKVIEENKVEGVTYEALNQQALGTGFARTIDLLGRSLEGRRQHETFFGRLVKSLPTGSNIGFLAPLVKIPALMAQILFLVNPWTLSPDIKPTIYPRNVADADLPEKFAKELLWMAEKLLDCGGMEEAIQQWSTNPSLAELSLCAPPRVQKSLVRLSALLCKGLVGETNIPQEACLRLVLLWLPLLCNATHGGDGPIFSSMEKCDAERLLEQAIMGLPQADQELILSTWLQEYAMSQSDWPNLQNCFNNWCHATRKLEHVKTEVIN